VDRLAERHVDRLADRQVNRQALIQLAKWQADRTADKRTGCVTSEHSVP